MLRELVHTKSLDTTQLQYDFISADCKVIKASSVPIGKICCEIFAS